MERNLKEVINKSSITKEKRLNSLKKSQKLIQKRSLRKIRRVKSLIPGECDSEEEEKEIIQILKSGTFLEKELKNKNSSNLRIPALQSNKISPQIFNKSNPEDKEYRNNNNISSLSKSSFKTSKINEEVSEESNSQKSDKSSSEFDINKSVHTSMDYSSQQNNQSNLTSNYSILQLREQQRRTDRIKLPDKRKTSASSKDNKKFQKRQFQSILYINEGNRADSLDSPLRNRKLSVASSVVSFSSKTTEKVNKEGVEKDKLQESKVSKKFSEQTTKRVVFLVLLVVMSEYIFQLSTYISNQKSYEYALEGIYNLRNEVKLIDILDFVKDYHQTSTPYRILKLEFYKNRMRNLESSPVSLPNFIELQHFEF